ncbi:MAG TPA: 16S rRNA (adenine(1518)-N(6)/adenine(1519)-N(6))-dimethyltransferase RsmA [Candidatus Acidoferrales bacterium]|nr:16S rRNA (adenine(1518)-N(6)/adenine(1519)-N(6))-dimethyltransferase RsmA [Candidatus Acidoferrales bacterium]
MPEPPLDLTDPATVTAVARRVGLRRDPRLGQHFLVDRQVLEAIVDALDPGPEDQVLEIGCGLGTLTGELAARAGRVVAIDIDPACVAGTEMTQRANANVTVLEMDARVVDPVALGFPHGWLATGNLPYQMTGLVLTRLLDAADPPARAVVLVQREVAARLAADSGDWSLATVAVRSHAAVERLLDVPPHAFDPPPAVHSSILRLVPARLMSPDVRADVLALAKPLFQSRRKTLRNGLSRALRNDVGAALSALSTAGIDPGRRPGTLALDEWELLARAVAEVRSGTR